MKQDITVKDSWKAILTDEMGLHEYAQERFGKEGLKYILYGHSMGSFVVRSIFSTPRYSRQFDGFVFSSTMGPNPAVGMGKFLASTACVFGGAKKKNRLLSLIAFGSYTKRIENPKTSYDWLSTVPEEVQKYIDDPMCGFYFTGEGFKTLFSLIAFMQSKEASKNYGPYRHEIQNEPVKEEYFKDLIDYFDSVPLA